MSTTKDLPPRVEELEQVADMDTVYRWPDCMNSSARTRMRHFALAEAPDKHRSFYVTFTHQPAPAEQPAPEQPSTDPAQDGPQTVRAARPLPNDGGQQNPWQQFGVTAGPPSLLPSDEGLVELFTAVRNRRSVTVATPAVSFATITTTQSGRDTSLLPTTRRAGPRRIAELGGIPTEQVSWGSSSAFPILGAGTPPGATAEGVAKPEYAAITAGSATPQTIAIWTDVSNQALSLANFEEKLRNKLARLVAAGENEILRAKVAGTAGVVTQTFVAGDQSVQILRSAGIIEAALNMPPNLLLYNPADTAAIFGTAVSNAAPAEVTQMSLALFGMRALPLATQPAGFVLMGAWSTGSRLVVGLNPRYFTNPYSQAKNNITTVMLEEALDIAVEEPEAFRTVDIVTP
jgi:hypothetical protein